MQFAKVGDTVVHKTHGTGTVKRLLGLDQDDGVVIHTPTGKRHRVVYGKEEPSFGKAAKDFSDGWRLDRTAQKRLRRGESVAAGIIDRVLQESPAVRGMSDAWSDYSRRNPASDAEEGRRDIKGKLVNPARDGEMAARRDQAELDGIERWVRDSGNATGEGADGWEWDPANLVLTIENGDGTTSTISGEDILRTVTPGDRRFDRIRAEVEKTKNNSLRSTARVVKRNDSGRPINPLNPRRRGH